MDENKAVYRGLTRAQLDAAYNNGRAVSDSPAWFEKWRARSRAVRAESEARLDVRYGPQPRQSLDYFPAGTERPPLFVFIHGGYWQRNEKATFAFVSDGPRARGIDVAVVGYTLAPEAQLHEIVDEIGRALRYLAGAAAFSFDRDRLIVGGWSAGGHLTAAVAHHPACKGGLAISGIFDLEPIALGEINDKLRLSPGEIAELSPVRNLALHRKPLVVAVGEAELPELKRQSEEYALKARAAGMPVTLRVLPGHHHFSILDEFAHPDGALTQALVELTTA